MSNIEINVYVNIAALHSCKICSSNINQSIYIDSWKRDKILINQYKYNQLLFFYVFAAGTDTSILSQGLVN